MKERAAPPQYYFTANASYFSHMKYGIVLCFFLLSLIACQSPSENTDAMVSHDPEQYDAELAAKLGADEYGMHQYVMAFLKVGPNRDQDSTTAANLQRAHMDNIGRLADEGKLVLAGPFMDDGEMRGIYIFNVKTVQEARALTKTDPAIQAGRLVMELHPWYGSAAVMQINDVHKRLTKTPL